MKLTTRNKQLVAGGLVVVFIVAILVGLGINQAFFSASGFVNQYLSALARGDAASALSMPGVADTLPQDADTTLLRGDALGKITDVSITQVTEKNSTTTVTASYSLDGAPASGTFTLERRGNIFGVFEGWAFANAPLAQAKITVLHDGAFNVGKSPAIDLRSTPSGSSASIWGGAGTYYLFAPGSYVFDRTDKYFTAKQVLGQVASPGETLELTVDVQASEAFNKAVSKNVNSFLDKCVTQHKPLPDGCPFGYETGNRFVGEPTWKVVEYPAINITPGEENWEVKDAVAVLNITGEVQSLYDGTISTLDENVEGTFSIRINFRADGSIEMQLY